MPDAFVVLHIPGVHIVLLPTTSTVQGVNTSFIPTENSDERLDRACAVVTITGLNLSLPWLDRRGWTRLLWRGHYPGKSVSIRLEQISRSPTCFEFFQTAKEYLSLRNMDCHWIENQFEKGILPTSFPEPSSLHFQTNTVPFSSTHTKCGWIAGEKYSLSHEASPWRPLTCICESTTWISPSKAKGANRLRRPRPVDLLTEPRPPTSLKQEQRSRNREKTQLFYLKQDWSAQPLDFWKLSKVIQCRTFSIRTGIYPPTHFRTLFGFSEKFSNWRPSLTQSADLQVRRIWIMLFRVFTHGGKTHFQWCRWRRWCWCLSGLHALSLCDQFPKTATTMCMSANGLNDFGKLSLTFLTFLIWSLRVPSWDIDNKVTAWLHYPTFRGFREAGSFCFDTNINIRLHNFVSLKGDYPNENGAGRCHFCQDLFLPFCPSVALQRKQGWIQAQQAWKYMLDID